LADHFSFTSCTSHDVSHVLSWPSYRHVCNVLYIVEMFLMFGDVMSNVFFVKLWLKMFSVWCKLLFTNDIVLSDIVYMIDTLTLNVSGSSAVSIVTGYGLELKSWFHVCISSIPALGRTQPPIQLVLGALCPPPR
jgi:hypothetical protein